MMRLLCVDHDDERIWAFPFQYMFGDDLLVVPACWEGLEEIEIYLPEIFCQKVTG